MTSDNLPSSTAINSPPSSPPSAEADKLSRVAAPVLEVNAHQLEANSTDASSEDAGFVRQMMSLIQSPKFEFWTQLIGSTLGLRLLSQYSLLQQLASEDKVLKFGLFYLIALFVTVTPVFALVASFSQTVRGKPLEKISMLHPRLRGLAFALWIGAFLATLLPLMLMQKLTSFGTSRYDSVKPDLVVPTLVLLLVGLPIAWGRKFSKFAFSALLGVATLCTSLLLLRGLTCSGGAGRFFNQFAGLFRRSMGSEALGLAYLAVREAVIQIPFILYPLMEVFNSQDEQAYQPSISKVSWQLPMINGGLFLLIGLILSALGGEAIESTSFLALNGGLQSNFWAFFFGLLTFVLSLGQVYGSLLFMTSSFDQDSQKGRHQKIAALLAPIIFVVVASMISTPLNLEWQLQEATNFGEWMVFFAFLISLTYFLGINKLSILNEIAAHEPLRQKSALKAWVLPLLCFSALWILPFAVASTVQSLMSPASITLVVIFAMLIGGCFVPAPNLKLYLESACEQLGISVEEFEEKMKGDGSSSDGGSKRNQVNHDEESNKEKAGSA